jgi:hypothetical protein
MLKAGMGIGLMPDWSIREELASGELIRLFTDYQAGYIEFENGVYAVYQKSRQPSPKLKVSDSNFMEANGISFFPSALSEFVTSSALTFPLPFSSHAAKNSMVPTTINDFN